jgi:outer membrane lipoprotein carrier protein
MRLFAVLFLAATLFPAQAPPAGPDLARQVQAHYGTVRDFTADFTQVYRAGVGRQTVQENGKVRIKKPGRMWWDYKSNDKAQVVADGSQLYSYLPGDRKVYVTPLPKPDEASSAMLFLTGRGDLLRDFTASVGNDQPPGVWRLDLVPKTPQADFTALTLVVDRKTLALQGLVTTDQSKSVQSYTFLNLKENVGLTDHDFEFSFTKLPKDVEVIRK